VFEFLLDDQFVNKILEEKTHVFVAKCAYRKEFKARHAQLLNILHKNAKKLRPFFHCTDARSNESLPNGLRKAMCAKGASDCDIKIAALACDRNRSRQSVVLVSNDPHFRLLATCFERNGVKVLSHDDFLSNQS
jgi:hypothetical protein